MSSDKIAYVMNEKGNLVPIMLTIETRNGTDYILERALMVLTNLEISCPEAQSFGQGVSVGYAVKKMHDATAEKAKVMGREYIGEELRELGALVDAQRDLNKNKPRTEAEALEDAKVGM